MFYFYEYAIEYNKLWLYLHKYLPNEIIEIIWQYCRYPNKPLPFIEDFSKLKHKRKYNRHIIIESKYYEGVKIFWNQIKLHCSDEFIKKFIKDKYRIRKSCEDDYYWIKNHKCNSVWIKERGDAGYQIADFESTSLQNVLDMLIWSIDNGEGWKEESKRNTKFYK